MGSTGSLLIRPGDIPHDAIGKTFKFREIVVCDSGVQKRMTVIGSETYT